MKAVIVVPYNPEWPKQFVELKNAIWPHIKDFAISIEHVGSTAVPGLAAKPVIDIDIVLPDMSCLKSAIDTLASIGYIHRGNLGIEDREAFRKEDATPKHNLYVCPEASLALKNHLCLRDSLRRDEQLRDQYSALKTELARKFPNSIDDYIEGKTEFILGILMTQGLGPDRLDEIRSANRSQK